MTFQGIPVIYRNPKGSPVFVRVLRVNTFSISMILHRVRTWLVGNWLPALGIIPAGKRFLTLSEIFYELSKLIAVSKTKRIKTLWVAFWLICSFFFFLTHTPRWSVWHRTLFSSFSINANPLTLKCFFRQTCSPRKSMLKSTTDIPWVPSYLDNGHQVSPFALLRFTVIFFFYLRQNIRRHLEISDRYSLWDLVSWIQSSDRLLMMFSSTLD